MSTGLKRKGSPSLEGDSDSKKRHLAEADGPAPTDSTAKPLAQTPADENNAPDSEQPPPAQPSEAMPPPTNDRAARFAALRHLHQTSRKANLHETRQEAKRAAIDPTQLHSLNRKKDIAQHKLLKADVEESGEDFERKRAWDWTVEESEKWDERVAEKRRRKEEVGFSDYRGEAGKVYERQIGALERGGVGERREAYEREKEEMIERSVRSGGLEIVETESGELIAVDKDGSFFSTADSVGAFANKPEKAAVDRLVEDIRKAEEVRLKKRRERGREEGDGGDVTYINEKNKQFNLKLARFYDKYTGEIRESFERGTAI